MTMHVTSDYYRNHEHQPEPEAGEGLVERWQRSIRNANKARGVEPLRPSPRTMRQFERHYESSHSLKHSA
jgi:hypothetical protein